MTASDSERQAEGHHRPQRGRELAHGVPEEAKDVAEVALGRAGEQRVDAARQRWESWLAWPVLIAAIASVPAVFLTLFDEPWEVIGHIGLYGATAVLVVETVVFFLISPQKVDWVRRNWWLIGLTVATVIAVIFSIGPMQLFRLVRSVGALRVLRAKQVAKAGESLAKKSRYRWRRRLGKVLATAVVSTFVVLALALPESEARSTLEDYVGQDGVPIAAAAAGLITLVAMYLLVRTPGTQDEDHSQDSNSSAPQG